MQYAKIDMYYSPLRVKDNYPSVVTYTDSTSGQVVGGVFKEEDQWYLSTCYQGWEPTPVSAKYEGFLILNRIHKIQKQGFTQ